MPSDNSLPIISKYLKRLNEMLDKESLAFFYVFRGQPQEKQKLTCTAARNERISSKDLLKDNQSKLINDLRVRGFGDDSKEKRRPLHDLELLADLRHYGTPSCLFDFTSNFLVALWFACGDKKGDKNENGKVFILNCHDTDCFSMVSLKTLEKHIDHFFDDKFKRLWYWIPERLNQRLTDQDAVFVLGHTEIKEYKSIQVEAKDKKKILEELEKFFDYSKPTLFSDKYALGESYGSDMDKPENLLEESIYYIQTGSFDKAKELLKQVIEFNNDLNEKDPTLLLEVNFQLGFAEIESMKEDLNKKFLKKEDKKKRDGEDMEDMEDLVSCCREVSESLFADCISKNYKEEKIKDIKKRFTQALDGLLPRGEPPNADENKL